LANTNTIITSQGATSTSYAAGLARAYTGGGYADWYLPSKDELNKLYLNRTAIGGFANDSYWSSTEIFNTLAILKNFGFGNQENLGKSYPANVRAIRAFSAVKSIEDGGTGATTQQTAINAITGTQISGRYLRSDGTNATLSTIQIGDVPTLNQNTTGNAATAGNITATVNTTLTSLSNLATVGTITTGVWSGTAVAVEKGGTGATTASAARTNLGLEIGTNVQAPLVAGTDYLAPTGSAASLTNFPTLNQNTTGNAATATTAGNITATTNTTLISLSNLATVGTITSGVWSGTAVAIAKGGTGLTSAGNNGQVLTSTGSGTLTWTGTHYIGETYGGGKVFYVYDNGKHGLIAATSDQSTGIRWYGGSNTNTRARGDGVGVGLKNTAIIIANQGAVDGNAFAATVCNEYSVTVDGVKYGDWYLPSKHELNLLYIQKVAGTVGGFANNLYWSSTEGGYGNAWYQFFGDGLQANGSEDNAYYVRAIRAF
jgi:hypothetical protein